MYIDTHLDTFFHMVENKRLFNTETHAEGVIVNIDLPKAQKGGLLAGFFTGFPNCTYFFRPESNYNPKIKIPDGYTDGELTDQFLAGWLKIVNNPTNDLHQLISKKELKQHIENANFSNTNQKIGAILHFEGASGIDNSLNKLYIYYAVGLRSIGLTWNETNQFATGVPGDVNRGLTTTGKDLLDAMESLGILIDVSHLNDKSFWDVHSHTNKIIFASHSNVRKRANVMRNLTNEMIKAIADSGGSIGINFCNGFLSSDNDHKADRHCAFEMIHDIISLTGSTDHVHIGSDFDGCRVPDDIKDVSHMPDFFSNLQEKLSLSHEDIKKIQYGNMLRIINNCWKN